MKNYQHIEYLLDKYWEGETSLDEEKILETFFDSGNIPAEFQAFQSIFQAKNDIHTQNLSADFDGNLLAILENKTIEKEETKIVYLQNPQAAELQKWRWMAGIAASIALILAVYIVMPKTTETVEIAKTELTKEERKEALKAYEQTKMALMFVSAKMNHGTQTAVKGLNKVKNLKQVIEEMDN
jgi:uncharacterized protein (DUF2126 family)